MPHAWRNFLESPDQYDGGELMVEDIYGVHKVKLPAGHLILYPASSLHHVTPVSRGTRLASFFWIQSMVRDDSARTLLFDLGNVLVHFSHVRMCSQIAGVCGVPDARIQSILFEDRLQPRYRQGVADQLAVQEIPTLLEVACFNPHPEGNPVRYPGPSRSGSARRC